MIHHKTHLDSNSNVFRYKWSIYTIHSICARYLGIKRLASVSLLCYQINGRLLSKTISKIQLPINSATDKQALKKENREKVFSQMFQCENNPLSQCIGDATSLYEY